MFLTDDIDVFIATHNRADLLCDSVASLLGQTAQITNLTIVDNESVDNTACVVRSIDDRRINYIKTVGFLGNFLAIQKTAKRPYILIFHDDDLLHPKYIEYVLDEINRIKEISIITTRYTEFVETFSSYPNALRKSLFFESQSDFAEHLYFHEVVAYAPAIYRTVFFKEISLEYDKFSKYNDWPFMVKMAKFGKSVIFDDKKLYYSRSHPRRDSVSSENLPNIKQIVNWDSFFYRAMSDKIDSVGFYNRFFDKMLYFSTGKLRSSFPDSFELKLDELFVEIKNSCIGNNLHLLFYSFLNDQPTSGKFLFSDNLIGRLSSFGQKYLKQNPDVAALNANPYWHYLRYGIWEKRKF